MKEIEESLVLNMGTSLILGDFVSYGTWGEKIDIFLTSIGLSYQQRTLNGFCR